MTGRCPSGQRKQTVNLPAQPTGVRIPPGPHGDVGRFGLGRFVRSSGLANCRTKGDSGLRRQPSDKRRLRSDAGERGPLGARRPGERSGARFLNRGRGLTRMAVRSLARFRIAVLAARLALNNLAGRKMVTSERGVAVVSLTTHGHRLDTVAIAIESIAIGTTRPRRMILWLEEPEFLCAVPQAFDDSCGGALRFEARIRTGRTASTTATPSSVTRPSCPSYWRTTTASILGRGSKGCSTATSNTPTASAATGPASSR